MPTETMLLSEALKTVKVLDSKIQEKIYKSTLVGVSTGQERNPLDKQFKNVEELETTITADYQSINDLIKRREAIHTQIQKTNVNTTVKVGDVEMTIIDAIEKKNSKDKRDTLLAHAMQNFSRATREIDQKTSILDQQIEKTVQGLFQGQTTKPDEKTVAQIQQSTKDQQYKMYGPALVDPLNIRKMIHDLEESNGDFDTKVDVALSVINATTTITVTY